MILIKKTINLIYIFSKFLILKKKKYLEKYPNYNTYIFSLNETFLARKVITTYQLLCIH